MRRAVAAQARTYLRSPTVADSAEFVAKARASRRHLRPFVHAPEDETGFRAWLARGARPDVHQFLVCRRADDEICGYTNINNVIAGNLQQAFVGWAAFDRFQGDGHLTEGVELVLQVAFTTLRLHRVEANIQPTNTRSRALAVRTGFRLEGYSPRYLRVGGTWQDHERWALLADDWRARRRPAGTPPASPGG